MSRASLAERPGFAFLDSAMFEPKLGRYSFIGIEPFGSFYRIGDRAAWNGVRLWRPPPLGGPARAAGAFAVPADPALTAVSGRGDRRRSL